MRVGLSLAAPGFCETDHLVTIAPRRADGTWRTFCPHRRTGQETQEIRPQTGLARDSLCNGAAAARGGTAAAGAGIAVSNTQKAAALDYLQALAGNDPQAIALTLHPDDLKALRLRILTLLHQEAKKGERARCCSRRRARAHARAGVRIRRPARRLRSRRA